MLVAVSATMGAGIVATTSPAHAAVDPPTFSADPLPTWQTNGAVWSLETIGNVVYVGGVFTTVRPPGVAEGGPGTVARNNFAAFDATTGDLLPCDPNITYPNANPGVYALEASPTGNLLYVGGRFSRVGATGVSHLVALNPATCALVPTTTFRRPALSSTVRALSATTDRLYVGGEFGTADGQARTRVAAYTASGQLTAAAVTLDATVVRAVMAAPDYGVVLIGGDFNTVNGSTNRGLVAVDPTTFAVVKTFPGWIPPASVPKVIIRDATSFYVGDEGSGFGVFDGRIAGDLATLDMRWKDYCLGATQTLAVDNGVLYAGHHTHECSTTPGGWLEDGFRQNLTAQATDDKRLLPTFFPDTNDGIGTAPQGPRALVVAADQLWVGGEFTTVNDGPQRSLTRFGRTDTGAVSAPALSVSTARPGRTILTWTAAFDRDEDALTYQVFRNDVVVAEITQQSRSWTRRQMQWVDTASAPGERVTYRLRVVEPDGGNTGARGAAVTVTAGSTPAGYAGAVLSDDPSLYWKMDELTEQEARTRTGDLYFRTRISDSSGNARQATAERGYTVLSPTGYQLGAPSALEDGSGASVRFNGASGRIAEGYTNAFEPVQVAPTEYSVELWFRSAASTGGRLAGFSDRRTEAYERVQPGSEPPVYSNSVSSTTDRVLYLTDAGQLRFGQLSGTTRAVTSANGPYDDTLWHHAVATVSAATGTALYVDGVRVATSPTVGTAVYPGYWKVGYDTLTGWSGRPAKDSFSGDLDEFAVYPAALTRDQVVAHYKAGRPSAVIDTAPPSAPAGVLATRTAQSVALTWDASTDDVAVAAYDVYRTATPDETLDGVTAVGTSTTPSFTEASVPAGTWSYRVVARDAAGNASAASPAATVTVPQPAQTVTLTPTADTFVNFGAKTAINGTTSSLIADSDPSQIILWRYVLPAAPNGLVLSGASLKVRTTSVASASSVDAHTVTFASDAWSEATTNWNNRPAVTGPSIGTLPAGSAVNTSYAVDLDQVALGQQLGTQVTLALVAQGPDSVILASREAAAASRPQLVLSFSAP